jgi:hypothetical protein
MPEIKKISDRNLTKVVVVGGSPTSTGKNREGVQIVGANEAARSGPLKILDRNSKPEETAAEVHIHADKKSFEEAVKKDQ